MAPTAANAQNPAASAPPDARPAPANAAATPPAPAPKPTPVPPVRTRAEALDAPVAYRNRARVRAVQNGDYEYARAANRIATMFRLLPPATHGERQRTVSAQFFFAPNPHARPTYTDDWENTVLEARHEHVEKHLTYVLEILCENVGSYDTQNRFLPHGVLPTKPLRRFLEPTKLTAPDDALRAALEAARAEIPDWADDFALFAGLSLFVRREMRFQSGTTSTRTTAGEAWTTRTGVCQDFTHILLALCRLGGLPARYASGFVPAEGAMHAWVEAALRVGSDAEAERQWFAFDPTHGRWATERYITVATGRDYFDVLPNSGTYFGGGPSIFRHKSRVVVEETRREEATPSDRTRNEFPQMEARQQQ